LEENAMNASTSTKLKRKAVPYYFIAPCAVLMGIILLYPLGEGIVSSFLNINLLVPAPVNFVGLENFIRLFKDPMFWDALYKSAIWTFSILACQMVVGFAIAMLLNQDIKGKKLFRCLVLIPWVIPNAIGAVTWKWILAEQYGLLNYMLQKIGIISSYKPWLSDTTLAFWAVVMVAVWKGVPFVTIVILAGLQSIDHSLYESAEVDGASSFRMFFQITLPLVKNIALTIALLEAIWNFNQFEIIQVITRGGPGASTLLMPIFTYRLFMQSFQISYASSAATIMLVVMIVPMYFYVKRLILE